MSISYDQQSAKERVRDATDIVELVGNRIPLKRSGRNYVGHCPWHEDKKPSFTVNPERQTFKCWPCDIGGDVFAFVMKMENVEFREALEILADRAGITLPKYSKSNETVETEEGTAEITRQQLFAAADWVATLYHRELLHSPEAAFAREYLERRKVSAEAIATFNIGYAPIDRNWLAKKVQNKPSKIKILDIIGCFGRPTELSDDPIVQVRTSRSDLFRGRLIFPIRDDQGRTVAFGGRSIPDSPMSGDEWYANTKYVNSPDTRLFPKHKILYGLDTAIRHIKHSRRALIMEGYTDCITAHEYGFGESVAVLGVALSADHIRLLTRMGAEKIILMLDGDAAGRRSAERDNVLIGFITHGVDMSVLTLPDGLDPCDFLEQYGTEALNALLQTETVDALEHIFRIKTRGIDLKNDIIGSSNALNAILGIIAHAPIKGTSPSDPIRLRIEKTLQHLSVRFGVSEDSINRQLNSHRQKVDRRQMADDGRESAKPYTTSSERWSKEDLPDMLEREMLELWLMDPTAIYAFWEHVLPEHLRSPITLSIYHQCNELVEHQEKPATFDNLMTAFDDPRMKNYLVELEMSGREKFFPDQPPELTERWKEPAFKALKERLTAEILSAFAHRETIRLRQAELHKLKSDELSEDEKMSQLLELQQRLRGNG